MQSNEPGQAVWPVPFFKPFFCSLTGVAWAELQPTTLTETWQNSQTRDAIGCARWTMVAPHRSLAGSAWSICQIALVISSVLHHVLSFYGANPTSSLKHFAILTVKWIGCINVIIIITIDVVMVTLPHKCTQDVFMMLCIHWNHSYVRVISSFTWMTSTL